MKYLYLGIGFILGVFITTYVQDFYKSINCLALNSLIKHARNDEFRYKNKVTKANYGGLAVGFEESRNLFCE